ncbi:hypothetical protein NPIL_492821 [Nephila pilipes]|uniref:Uncharacterized protein n=1 Tax=Nephila pilipes TaxID=299642 RepID=A0A8X6NDG6_NEPPI|nr:hypothetical protein NPIL_492821 [Nephila pilipes]
MLTPGSLSSHPLKEWCALSDRVEKSRFLCGRGDPGQWDEAARDVGPFTPWEFLHVSHATCQVTLPKRDYYIWHLIAFLFLTLATKHFNSGLHVRFDVQIQI